MKKHLWFWITLFVLALLLLVGLATLWSVDTAMNPRFQNVPWFKIILGSLGFLATLVATVLFFVRLVMEMRLNQLQSEFLARISHELKSPITSLELTSSMLRETTSPSHESSQLWNLFDAELKRLKVEVDLILETSRWEAKPAKADMKKIDLGQWIEVTSEHWRAILGANSELKRTGDLRGAIVLTDPRLLELITNNIVDNARKFARDVPRLTVDTRIIHSKSNNVPHWQISFIDEGWGFDPRQSKKLFKRFYRADSSAPRAIAGTGLGLYLARAASRDLGLHITGTSEGLGRGARFTIEGPLA